MQRTVVLAVVAGLIVVASLVAAMALPRFDCPEGFRLIDTPERWPQPHDDVICVEMHPLGTPGAYEVSDRLWFKIGFAIAGTVLGGALAVSAFSRGPRGKQATAMTAEAG